ncbi:hypothetical protein [Paenibacillus soyae]|uniref:Uncharacterized protein n=1 Tax=Paenibacillus soyae TaxID=2969249 RepID=A0A9X2S8W8_9BACL|nr:hypothetical protein [Paenibacillus soyae]MCR2804859.1 hypothetical protein [Paenibacillus soyae]
MTASGRNAPPPAHVYLPTASTARSNPMDMEGYARCRVYLLAAGDEDEIDVTLLGAPNEDGPYLEEISELARRFGVKGSVSYVMEDISRYLIVEATRLQGNWTIWVVPMRG